MVVQTGKIGGNGAPSCPCIVSWPEVVTYANGGAGPVRMSTEADGLIQVLRTRMASDKSRKWVQQPEWVGFLEKRSFNANYAGYFDARPPDTPANLAGQWHFVRRLADDELVQMKQFRLENALDVDFDKWDKKFEYAIFKGLQKAPSRGAAQLAGMATLENLGVFAGSVAVMFGPQGVVLGIARAVLQIVGFGAQALHWGSMIEDFGARVFSARRPRDLDAAADVLADLLGQIAIAGFIFLFQQGVQQWREAAAAARARTVPVPPRVVNYAMIRQALQRFTSAVRGGPFNDFPRFRYARVAVVRNWLEANGFQQVANAHGDASEIWIRTRPDLGGDTVEAVRIDPEGHVPNARDLARPAEGYFTLDGASGAPGSERLQGWGNGPHMHKELVPRDLIMDFMHDTNSGMFVQKITDWNTRSLTGRLRWESEHIVLNP
jgi:hypothetical protein